VSQVETLAKSMCIAGALGSSALPVAAEATTEGKSEAPFTSISNRGAIGLAKIEVGDAAKVPASE
jgi:oxidoreductase